MIFDCFGVLAEDGWLPFKRRYIGDNTELAQDVADLGKQNEYGIIDNKTYYQRVAEMVGADEEELRAAIHTRVPNEELLTFIRGKLQPQYKIGLLSNANYDVVQDLFSSEQADLFDAAVLSYQTRLVKPDAKMFELMASQLGVKLEECIFVDDIERYCTAASMLGMSAIVYENPGQCMTEIEKLLS